MKEAFTDAVNIINKYVALSHQQDDQPVVTTDPVEEIRKYKQLADDGIISNEVFEAKKNQLLGL
ncbi:SHOCT domain-containing protein [Lactiplantibacillus daowaiensis]|uniref:SHOCT domain-containing protein n=1 Tax=Lactiplantibacillus daowaiensis TaxID=2559918 RepID=A0ABW1S2D7_9LACO|nr:SHOCT domain-containing protein [Lactiplantibacillus daowaiensis]